MDLSTEEFIYFPASFENLVRMKNLIQESDPENNAFPTSRGKSWEINFGNRSPFYHPALGRGGLGNVPIRDGVDRQSEQHSS